MIAWLIITLAFVCVVTRADLTLLGRVVATFVWLALTVLWLATAHAQVAPCPEYIPPATPRPYNDLPSLRCVPANDAKTVTCCWEWRGEPGGRGYWLFRQCVPG